MRRLTIVLTAVTLLVAACGSDSDSDALDAGAPSAGGSGPPIAGACAPGFPDCDDTPAAPGDSDVSRPADPGHQPDTPAAELIEPHEGGTTNTRIQNWEDHEMVAPDRVRIFFTGGVDPCFVVDRVEVDERADEVTLTLYTGAAAGSEGTACIEIAKYYALDVDLEAPLNDRQLFDGAEADERSG